MRIEAPAGWKLQPERREFSLSAAGERARFTFDITAPASRPRRGSGPSLKSTGCGSRNGLVDIQYDHIPRVLLQPKAGLTGGRASILQPAARRSAICRAPATTSPSASTEMGYAVTTLSGSDLTAERLRAFDAVVLGVRAFNTRTDIAASIGGLFTYVEAGGTAIVQYSRPGRDLKTQQLAPYSLSLSNDRVTEEDAPVTLLVPDHPVLNTPNKIGDADFEGWVQERGVYFANQWDEHFTPILASGDTGATPLKGGLLVARYGKGWFVYTGLAFFRATSGRRPGRLSAVRQSGGARPVMRGASIQRSDGSD